MNVDDAIERLAKFLAEFIQSFCLSHVARKAVQHIAVIHVIFCQTFLNDTVRNFIRNKFALINKLLSFKAHRRTVLHCGTENITC